MAKIAQNWGNIAGYLTAVPPQSNKSGRMAKNPKKFFCVLVIEVGFTPEKGGQTPLYAHFGPITPKNQHLEYRGVNPQS